MTECLVAQALALLLAGKQVPNLTQSQWSALMKVARNTGVLSMIAMRNQPYDKFPEPMLAENLTAAANHFAFFRRQVLREVHELARHAGQAGIHDITLLKGAAYIAAGYKAGNGRFCSDIDALVSKDNIPVLEKKLNLLGWFQSGLTSYDEKYYREWSHEIPPLKHVERKTVLDIHHNLIPVISNRAPDIRSFTRHKIHLFDNVYVLRPAAMVLHSAIHLFTGEEFQNGFRDLNDLYSLFETFADHDGFWQDLQSLAEETRFTRELYLAVSMVGYFYADGAPKELEQLASALYPGKLKARFYEWLFSRLLAPWSELIDAKRDIVFARWMGFLRGHYLKMPLPVLLMHPCHKIYVSAVEIFSGVKAKP
ncbi:MAG TPA: hypothetical protein DCW59_15290 [Alteromonas sp.]|nr:hypothetical protein [Alteromonas sp.]